MAGISVVYDVMTNLKAKYEGLSFASPISTFVIQEIPMYQNQDYASYPFVSIAPFGPEKITDQTNYRDGYEPKILVGIVGNQSVSLENRLQWRQNLMMASNNCSFTSMPELTRLKVTPGPILERAAYLDRKGFVSTFLVEIESQLVRL